jgi:16S rRNA A1518/A1519 N6-dimethyltransferase RsmA/KsgA/DIM1 with predicted DNA glycosylase/AP lyase activity
MNTIPLSPPFVATSVETVKELVDFLHAYKGLPAGRQENVIVDLGSGDGRIVVELAKKGHIVAGFETKSELVKRANERITELHLEQTAKIFEKDYWHENLNKYSLVYIYGIPAIMGKLEEKLENELTAGAIVISNVYRLLHWKIKRQIGTLNLYIKS